MRTPLVLSIALGLIVLGRLTPRSIVSARSATANHGSVGVGHGVLSGTGRSNPCGGTQHLNFDGSAESGDCWQYGGIVPPTYGAFAECYDYAGGTCGIALYLISIGNPTAPATIMVWSDANGVPGNVLAQAEVTPQNVPIWPNVGEFDYPLSAMPSGSFWIGYWADFSQQGCGYYVAADLDGFGGCPMTNIAPLAGSRFPDCGNLRLSESGHGPGADPLPGARRRHGGPGQLRRLRSGGAHPGAGRGGVGGARDDVGRTQ